MPDDWSDRRDALPHGCVLRDYTIEEVLGHGGFGIVYKARHNELDHVVAIKEYLPSEFAVREGVTIRSKSAECDSHFADGLRRFREEAKALIEFQQHPSIVDCREFFRANGTAYLVMEYVEGLPLSELLRQREAAGRPFTESDLLAIAIPLAQGLAHIHRAGVIHRDIKPANILVRRSDQQPVLIDFGAAKQAVAEHSRSLAPYTEGYAALEQVADGQLGPWTDLYGFGAVLWRMVAGGSPPWDPPNPVKVESRANARVREVGDPLPTAKELGEGCFAEQTLEMIDGCLQLRDTERIRESDRVVEVLQGSDGESQQSATAEPQAEGSADVDQQPSGRAEAQPGRSSTGRWWKIAGVATAVIVAVAMAALALIPRDLPVNENSETPERWSFTIEAEPETAAVAFVNGSEAYRPGVLLVPGRYEVEVAAPGYATHREWVTHAESETLLEVKLERLPDAVSELAQTPSDGATEASDSPAVEQEKAPSDVPDSKQPLAGAQPEPAQTPSARPGRNHAAESYKQACEAGNATDCYNLGYMYYTGDGVEPDRVRAAELFRLACEGGVASGCGSLGHMYAEGEDKARAAELYGRACEYGDAIGCGRLGRMYYNGEGVGQDLARAAELQERACEGGDYFGCAGLGYMYAEGEGVQEDKLRAAELYRRACEGGATSGCNNLGIMYGQGEGVTQDSRRAAELYSRACEGGDATGCGRLGNMYRHGEGVRQDRARAAELFERACDGGVVQGCVGLAYMYYEGEGVRQDRARAADSFERACESGDYWGCSVLGYMYADGEGVQEDKSRAAEFYSRACEGGVTTDCGYLAEMYYEGEGVAQDLARAAELYGVACDAGEPGYCHMLGHLYCEGEGVAQNRARAAEFYEIACEGGDTMGCSDLGFSYARGEGAPKDLTRAMNLYERACDSGVAPAGCYNLYEGEGVPEDFTRAAEVYEQRCDDTDATGCFNLGYMHFVGQVAGPDALDFVRGRVNLGFLESEGEGARQDPVRAAEFYQRACDGGIASGCFQFALLYAYGDGMPRDQARATESYRRACAGDYMSGCAALARSYYRGDGISQDRSVAQELFERACEGGHQDACEELESLDW